MGSHCFPAGGTVTFTGNVSPQGTVGLASASVNGQIINVTGTVSTAGTNGVGYLANATYTVTGECLGGDQAQLSPFEMLNGTLAGSFQTANGLIGITVTFAAPRLPATDGAYPMNGTATFTNAGGCGGFTSAQVQSGTDYEVNKSFILLTNTGSTITIDGPRATDWGNSSREDLRSQVDRVIARLVKFNWSNASQASPADFRVLRIGFQALHRPPIYSIRHDQEH